jgi:hypothetical protein
MPIWAELDSVRIKDLLADHIARWWRVQILVVADTIVSLGPEHHPDNLNEDHFGMGHLLGVLQDVGQVTKAHRTTDPLDAPGVIENFRFNEHNLGAYDQIWLLGYGSGELPVDEQKAIAAFMNSGGGIFATGDHASLGSALAGNLPRVRSMRHWSSPPPATGPTRVDTTRPDVHDVVVFENQSDDIPQKLELKWYEWSGAPWFREVYPHPVLCSRWGAIDQFPDHMHEGEVVEPANLDAVISLPGMTFDEYPRDSGGRRVSPEVVAWGWSAGRADPEVMHGIHVGDPGPANKRWTGTVGVYDGRRCGVGRIVVDSTWHHFFDINLIGDNAANRPGFADPRAPLWRKGFTFSPEGMAVLAKIDQYFRNIVRWLSPNAGILAPFDGLVVQLALTHQVREVLETTRLSPMKLGAYAWEYALRFAPPCTVLQLTLPEIYTELKIPILPWDPPRPDPPPEGFAAAWPIPPREMAQAALGGALQAFAELGSLEELRSERGPERLRAGAVGALATLVREELGRARQAVKDLEAAAEHLQSPQASAV